MKNKKLIALFLIVIVIILAIVIYVKPTNVKLCLKDEHCQLSLCDCKCHTNGFTPERLSHFPEISVCGVNCFGIYNVTGCKCVNYRCVEIGTYTTPPLEYMND